MEYKHETVKRNYEDLSSGRVLYNAQGTTSFPARLASEIIQRCFKILLSQGHSGPYTIYDPCCGGGYLLTILGFLHGNQISGIYASDVDDHVVELARRNLSLLSECGLAKRKEQLEHLYNQFGKQSHLLAIQSAERLSGELSSDVPRQIVGQRSSLEIDVHCTVNDITASSININNEISKVNIVISDFPYGDIVNWKGSSMEPMQCFFNYIYDFLEPQSSVIAVIANEKLRIDDPRYKRIDYFKNGKRYVGIYTAKSEKKLRQIK